LDAHVAQTRWKSYSGFVTTAIFRREESRLPVLEQN
jgi:hypothetical protein